MFGAAATARRLGEMLRVRSISRLGADLWIGIGSSIAVAATAPPRPPLPKASSPSPPIRPQTGSVPCRWRPYGI
ncbi:hypothetical protein ADK55_18705, partial [Streptomyces sp. WM4235]